MGCVFAQTIVNSVFVMIVHVVAHQPTKMWFVECDHVIEDLAPATPTHRSAIPFCQGACTLVRFGSRPVAFRNVTTSLLNVESRSKMAQRYGPAPGKLRVVVARPTRLSGGGSR